MEYYHLAQVNIARARAALHSPTMADFVASLHEINLLAEKSPGFVWRLREQSELTSSAAAGDGRLIVNMSVWQSLETLREYVYRSAHNSVIRRRAEWFEPMTRANLALWWIPAGHEPSLGEARERLAHLRRHGECRAAFTFRAPSSPPDAPASPLSHESTAVAYDRLAFRSIDNAAGEVDPDTRFFYRQAGSRVWATYRGGAIAFGTLVAAAAPDGRLDVRYQHVNRDGDWREGRCETVPERLPDGCTNPGGGRPAPGGRAARSWSRCQRRMRPTAGGTRFLASRVQ
jgi:Domain of unknown function (DUF3291)